MGLCIAAKQSQPSPPSWPTGVTLCSSRMTPTSSSSTGISILKVPSFSHSMLLFSYIILYYSLFVQPYTIFMNFYSMCYFSPTIFIIFILLSLFIFCLLFSDHLLCFVLLYAFFYLLFSIFILFLQYFLDYPYSFVWYVYLSVLPKCVLSQGRRARQASTSVLLCGAHHVEATALPGDPPGLPRGHTRAHKEPGESSSAGCGEKKCGKRIRKNIYKWSKE